MPSIASVVANRGKEDANFINYLRGLGWILHIKAIENSLVDKYS
jgi:hypothetical protein